MPATRERTLRLGLVAMAISAMAVGVPATITPHGFFDGFPFVAHWVDRLGVYNQHLTSDVGTLYLAFAALFLRAAATLQTALVVPLCFAWAAAQTVHLGFHVVHLSGFPVVDAVVQTLALATLAAVPAALAVLARGRG